MHLIKRVLEFHLFICLFVFDGKFSTPATDNDFCALSSIITPEITDGAACENPVYAESSSNPCRLSSRGRQPATA